MRRSPFDPRGCSQLDGDELEMFINVTGTSRVQAHKLLREANAKGQAVDEAIRCALCALHPASGLCLDTPVVLCSVYFQTSSALS